MTDEVLEDLPYDELRHRAFALAERRLDIGFFVELLAHAPAIDSADESGSLGDVGAGIGELVESAHQVFGAEGVGDLQPLFVARFATYIREHDHTPKD